MAQVQDHSDRRHFSRRKTALIGLLQPDNAPSMICGVTDLSRTGACLEIKVPFLLKSRVVLIIGNDGFSADCIVRRQSETTVGVEFLKCGELAALEDLLTGPTDTLTTPPSVAAPLAPRNIVHKGVGSRQLRELVLASIASPPMAALGPYNPS